MAVYGSPRGLIVDLVTPLEKTGDIDVRGLGRLLKRVMPHAQALLVSGPLGGEGNRLGVEQREVLFRETLHQVQGRVPLFFWITHETEDRTRDTLTGLKKCLDRSRYTGRIFWVDTPLYYHSNRGLPSLYQDLSSMVDEPFILYNHPDLVMALESPFKRNNIRTSILKELAGLQNINGMIFSGSLDRARHYQKAVRSRVDFRLYDGEEERFLTHPSLSGVVSIGANLSTLPWRRITASSLNFEENQGVYPDHLRQIWDLGTYLHDLIDLYRPDPIPIIKGVLSHMGVIEHDESDRQRPEADEIILSVLRRMREYGEKV